MWDVTRWYCQGTCEWEGVGVIWGIHVRCDNVVLSRYMSSR